MADKTGVILFEIVFGMTFSTVIHLHAIPCICLIPGNISSPDVDAVPGHAIDLVCRQFFGFPMVSVAGFTVLVPHLDMGYMGEVHTVRLPVVGEPWYLPFFGNIFSQELLLFRCFTEGRLGVIMAFYALVQFGDAGKGAILPERMARQASFGFCVAFDAVYYFRIKVKGMIKIHGLGLF
jgi:hypothetical protein